MNASRYLAIAALIGCGDAAAAPVGAGIVLRAKYMAQHDMRPTTAGSQLVSGKILSASLTANAPPGVPSLSFSYSLESGYYYQAIFTFASPSGKQFNFVTAYDDSAVAQTGGTDVVENSPSGINLYAQPGTWTMISASIGDGTNNTIYTGSALAALFPSLTYTVKNTGTQDIVPPTVTSGHILTPSVSLSSATPYFSAAITASDAKSGVYSVSLLLKTPSGALYTMSSDGYAAAPFRKAGSLAASTALYSFYGATSGTWTIAGYEVCDAALNCVDETNAAAIAKLFGTASFTVTP